MHEVFFQALSDVAETISGRVLSTGSFRNYSLNSLEVATDALSKLFEATVQNPDKYGHVPRLDPNGDEIGRILYKFCVNAACTLRQQVNRHSARYSDCGVDHLPHIEDGDNAACEVEKKLQWKKIQRVCSAREWEILQMLCDCEGNYTAAAAKLQIDESYISHIIRHVRQRIGDTRSG